MNMHECRVEPCAALCLSSKPTYHHNVLTSVNELLGFSTKVIEVLRHRCKHFGRNALGSTERPRRRTSAPTFRPLDLRIIQRENRWNILPVESIIPTSNCFYILL